MDDIPWIPLVLLLTIVANILLALNRRKHIRKKILDQFKLGTVIFLDDTRRSFNFPSIRIRPTIRIFGSSYPFITYMELVYLDYFGQQVKTLVAAEDYFYKVNLYFENRV